MACGKLACIGALEAAPFMMSSSKFAQPRQRDRALLSRVAHYRHARALLQVPQPFSAVAKPSHSAHLYQAPVRQRNPAVHARRQTLVVRYHHQAGAELHVQFEHQSKHRFGIAAIEVAGGLVRQQ